MAPRSGSVLTVCRPAPPGVCLIFSLDGSRAFSSILTSHSKRRPNQTLCGEIQRSTNSERYRSVVTGSQRKVKHFFQFYSYSDSDFYFAELLDSLPHIQLDTCQGALSRFKIRPLLTLNSCADRQTETPKLAELPKNLLYKNLERKQKKSL